MPNPSNLNLYPSTLNSKPKPVHHKAPNFKPCTLRQIPQVLTEALWISLNFIDSAAAPRAALQALCPGLWAETGSGLRVS